MRINYAPDTGDILSVGDGVEFQGIEYIDSLPTDFLDSFSLGKYKINIATQKIELVPNWVAPNGYVPPVRSIDMRRLRLALLQMELLDDIDAAILAQPRQAQIEWEYATKVKTNHPLIVALATAMSLDVNAIFDLGESLV